MANMANGILYGCFTFFSIVAGSVLNRVGPRTTMLMGCTGYPVFNGAMWYFSKTGHLWYPIFAGVYLGIAAGCLWTTAVFMSVAYSEESTRGFWRSIQWLFNAGGAGVGSAVALGISWNAKSTGVPTSVYIVFIIIQLCSLIFASLIQPPATLKRSDGTSIAHFERISTVDTLKILGSLFKDWRVLILLPCMLLPEMCVPLLSTMNGYAFNLRTRTLNTFLNSLIQFPVTLLVGWILDSERLGNRRRRLMCGISFLAVWLTGTYIAQTIWLASWKFNRKIPGPAIDVTSDAYPGAIVIYLLYAAQYGSYVNIVVYTWATITNDPRKLAALGSLFMCGKYHISCFVKIKTNLISKL
jgi:MFS family permease